MDIRAGRIGKPKRWRIYEPIPETKPVIEPAPPKVPEEVPA